MQEIIVKNVDVMGDAVMAAKDNDGNIWASVGYICKALGMTDKQKDNQVSKVQTDKTLCRGSLKFQGGVFDPNNETVGISVDVRGSW